MSLRKSCCVPLLLALGVFLAAGCSGSDQGNDPGWGGEDDVLAGDGFEEVDENALRLTLVTPSPDVERIVSGELAVKVRLDDPLNLPATVTFAYSKGMIGDAIVEEVDGPGDVEVTIDTAAMVSDARRKLVVTAQSEDGRTATASVIMTVDNDAPTITPLDPTPQTGGNFMGDLVVNFSVADAGTGVTKIVVRIEDFQYLWPTSGTTTGEKKVDTGEIVIPTSSWTSGAKQMTVEAYDGLESHSTIQKIDLGFVSGPQFLGGDIRTLPGDFAAREVAGVRLGLPAENTWGVVVVGNAGAQVITRNNQSGRLARRAELLQVGVSGLRVQDVNADNLDDIVIWGAKVAEGQLGVLYVFLQTADGMFYPPTEIPLPYAATDLAIGDLNGDGLPDFAMVMNDTTQTLGLVISDDTGAEPTWGAAATYGGAVSPNRVTIADIDGAAVVLTRANSPIVTVFPVDGSGVPSGGRNSTIMNGEEPISGVAGLVGIRFDGTVALPNFLIATDPGANSVLTIQRDGGAGDSARVVLASARTTGITPARIAAADFNNDGLTDVAVLCKGGNLVQTFPGTESGLATGPAFAVGGAQSLSSADLDSDGYRDLVVLDTEGTKLSWIRFDPDAERFAAAPMALLGFVPKSLALGKFTKTLLGYPDLLDAAVLGQSEDGKYHVVVKAGDGESNVPMLDTTPSLTLTTNAAERLFVGNYNQTFDAQGLPIGDPGLDDLVVATNAASTWVGTRLPTADIVLFKADPTGHTAVSATLSGLDDSGDRPRLMAVADFDRAKPGESSPLAHYSVLDLVVLEEHLDVATSERSLVLQPYLGQGDGTFSQYSIIAPPVVETERNVQQVVAAPVRRTLQATLANEAKDIDLITVNAGTGDITVYLKARSLNFLATQSKDFAVGSTPKAVAVGFLEDPIPPDVDPDTLGAEASDQLPDIVTLLANDVVISYSVDNGTSVQGLTNWNLLDYEPPVSLEHQGRSAVAVALADMNGDDYLDILVLNQGTATLSVYINLANRQFSAPYDFPVGVGSFEMAVGDVNGDGCPDVVTADQGGQTLTILRNTVCSAL